MDFIYHLTIPSAWDAALIAGEYRADSLATEGFIHASTPRQVEASANRFFAKSLRIVLLKINPDKSQSPLIWEPSSHSDTPFPHIYGPINLDAVIEATLWDPSPEGTFRWPPSSTA